MMKTPSWQLPYLEAVFINIPNNLVNIFLKSQKLCFLSIIREKISPVLTPKCIKARAHYYVCF